MFLTIVFLSGSADDCKAAADLMMEMVLNSSLQSIAENLADW